MFTDESNNYFKSVQRKMEQNWFKEKFFLTGSKDCEMFGQGFGRLTAFTRNLNAQFMLNLYEKRLLKSA